MRGIRWVASGLLALILVGCGCTLEGCGFDLRFDSEMLAQWTGAEELSLEVCVDGDCESRLIDHLLDEPFVGMPLEPGISGSVEVNIEAMTDAGSRTASGTIQLGSYRPNGAFCSPVCPTADVAIDDEILRNAEPGEVAPRD